MWLVRSRMECCGKDIERSGPTIPSGSYRPETFDIMPCGSSGSGMWGDKKVSAQCAVVHKNVSFAELRSLM